MAGPIAGKAYPFVETRRVRWGEADPARIAYTPRFLDYAMEAIESFLTDRLGASFYEFNMDHGWGTPFVQVELNFRSPLTPRDMLATEVRIARLGGSSVTFAVTGRVEDRISYDGRLVCAFVDTTGPALKPIAIPPRYRERLEPDLIPG